MRGENAVMLVMLVEGFSAKAEWRKRSGGSRVFQACHPLIGSLKASISSLPPPCIFSLETIRSVLDP